MTSRALLTAAVLVVAASFPRVAPAAPSVPAPFVIEDAVSGATFDTPTGIAFLPDGRYFVTEKRGRVYMVTNEIKSANPVWSREAEVLNEHDRGLLGIAVDPNYYANHYLYLLYTVDPDSNNVDTSPSDAFGRLVRYQVGFTDSTQVVNSSRTVLMGVSWRAGPLSASPSHTIGSLRFASDGSLLVSVGDGASYTQMDAGGLDGGDFGSGPNLTNPYEDIGAFRAQSLTSLCGKILRLDPSTGGGYPSNPYYDGNPFSIRSRVWAYGLRNPFRFTIRPGTGATNPTTGNPGTLYIGEVGWTDYEEMNVATSGGINFGWPCYEGFGQQPSYQAGNPAHNDCSSFGTPDNPTSQTSPKASWNHSDGSLSTPLGLVGNCSIGGAFYTGSQYPGSYAGRYFFADYGQDWLKVATVSSDNQLLSIQDFGTGMDGPVDFAAHPITKDLYYVAINTGQVRRLRYPGGGGNAPPVAVANGAPTSGIAPLTVNFSSAGSFDPNNDPLLYSWSFGDATGSTAPNPSHTYANSGLYVVILTLDDQQGGVGRDTVFVTVSGASSSFPTTPVVDDFNRPNGPLGTPWVDELAGLSITSNALAQNGGSNSVEWAGTAFGPDQEAYVTLATIDPFASEHDLMLKVQAEAWWTGHIEVRYDATTHHIDVATYTPGPGFQGVGSIAPVTLVNGDQFGARALGDGTVEVYVNGTLRGMFSVASWPYAAMGGYIGLTIADAHTSRLDNFGGGDVAVAPNTPPTGTILSPLDGSFYATGDTIRLSGSGTDAQDPPDSLDYHWQMDIHHNTHIHPSSFVSDLMNDFYLGENHDDGTGVFEQIMLMITDTGNLVDTAFVRIYPEIDAWPTIPIVQPELVVAGAKAWITFWFHNGGRMPTPVTHWQLLLDGTLTYEGDTLVAGGDSAWISRPLQTNLSAGSHQARAVVDSLNRWVETSETNNGATLSFDVVTPPTGVEMTPAALALSEARPNPSFGTSRFTLSLPKESSVDLSIFDLQGREVWRDPPRRYAPGTWELKWTGGPGSTPAGVYLARVRVDGMTFVRRIARVH